MSYQPVIHKVLVVGQGQTGKTSLVRRYVFDVYHSVNKATVGVDFALKVVDRNTTMQIWDIAGQENYGCMTGVYYREAVGAMVVCDALQPESLASALKWKRDIDSKVFLRSGERIPCFLLVNKIDLAKDGYYQTKEEMDAICREHKFCGWFESSAKENTNIDTAFAALVERIREVVKDEPSPTLPTLGIRKSNKKSTKPLSGPSCCN